MRFLRAHLALFVLLMAWPWLLKGEAFGNNSISIPKVGLVFFDVPFFPHKKPWGIDRQWIFGAAFMQAVNYRWWWMLESFIGFGKTAEEVNTYLGSFFGGAGLRYNILQNDFRPHVSMMIHYLQLLGNGTKALPLNLGWPIFVGIKSSIGLEWLFYSEMALLLDGSYALYFNINEPFRQVFVTNLSFAIYF